MKKLKKTLSVFIETARSFGVDENDLKNAQDFLDYHEYGLCFDTLITQMYEFDIHIDDKFYEMICEIGEEMKLPKEDYSFMRELIIDNNI